MSKLKKISITLALWCGVFGLALGVQWSGGTGDIISLALGYIGGEISYLLWFDEITDMFF